MHSLCTLQRRLQKRTPLKALGHARTPQAWLKQDTTTSNVFLQAGLGAGITLGSPLQHSVHTVMIIQVVYQLILL